MYKYEVILKRILLKGWKNETVFLHFDVFKYGLDGFSAVDHEW